MPIEVKTRHRACGAVFWNEHVLMVRHVHDGRDYWTLPGGGIEPGETASAAAEREVLEETGIDVRVDRFVCTLTSKSGRNSSHCFLMMPPAAVEVSLGADPEEAHLERGERMLQGARWHPVDAMRRDLMLSQVLDILEAEGWTLP